LKWRYVGNVAQFWAFGRTLFCW